MRKILALLALLVPSVAFAQTDPCSVPDFATGGIPTAAEWASCFNSRAPLSGVNTWTGTNLFSTLSVGIAQALPVGTLFQISNPNAAGVTEGRVLNNSTVAGTQARLSLATGTTNASAVLAQNDGATPSYSLTTGAGDTGGILFDASAATAAPLTLKSGTGGELFFVGGTQFMTLDSIGRLLIGPTSGTSGIPVDVQVSASGASSLVRSKNTAAGANTIGGFTGATGSPNATFSIYNGDGASPFSLWSTGAGDTGGITIDASAATGAAVTVKSNTGGISLQTSGGTQAQVTNTATAVNNLTLTGSATTVAPAISVAGTDTNIGLTISGKGTGALSLGTGTNTVKVGVGGSSLANGIVAYSQSITPTATSAAIQTALQTTTVTGLQTTDTIYVNGPAPTSLCPMVGARVSATNTLQLEFAVLTAAACTPAAGTYTIIAIR